MNGMKLKAECAACPVKIWEIVDSKFKKTKEYNEIDVKLNDLSKMTVGVCPKHLKPRKLDLQIMTEKIHQGWLEEIAFDIGNKEWVKNTGLNLEIVGVQ